MSKELGDGRIPQKVSEVKHHTKIHLEIDGPVLLLYRTRLGGWQPSPHHMMLNHQLYEMKLFSIVEKFSAREVVAVNPTSGEWETIWLHERAEKARPESYGDEE